VNSLGLSSSVPTGPLGASPSSRSWPAASGAILARRSGPCHSSVRWRRSVPVYPFMTASLSAAAGVTCLAGFARLPKLAGAARAGIRIAVVAVGLGRGVTGWVHGIETGTPTGFEGLSERVAVRLERRETGPHAVPG